MQQVWWQRNLAEGPQLGSQCTKFLHNFMNTLRHLMLAPCAAYVAIRATMLPAFAQDFLGPVPDIGRSDGDVRTVIEQVIRDVLTFLALIAVVVIVIAGIRLVVSGGDEGQKDGAKKMIIYAVVGLLIIILARVLVDFVITTITGEPAT